MFSAALMLLLAAGSCVYSIDLIQPDSMVVQPGQSLTITCQVSGYSLTDKNYATGWIRQCEGKPMDWIFHQWGGSTGSFYHNIALKNKFTYSRDMSAGTATIKGLNLQPEDTAVYYCVRRVVYKYGNGAFDYWGKGTTVTVSSATPRAPTLFPLAPCGSGTGDMVTLGCLATEFTPSSVTFSWTKSGTALTDFIQYPPVQKGEFYTGVSEAQVRRQDWEAKQSFHCIVTHPEGTVDAQIPPYQPPIFQLPTLKVLASTDDGSEASFSCFAKDFSPKEYKIKWLKDDGEIFKKLNETIMESQTNDGKTLYSVASFLTVSTGDLITHSTKFTCEFQGKNENGDAFVNSTVTYGGSCSGSTGCEVPDVEVEIKGPTMTDMFVENKGTLVCQVKINEPKVMKIFWEDENGKSMIEELAPDDGLKGLTEVSLDITYDEWTAGIKRVCVVQHTNFLEPIKRVYERKTVGLEQPPSVFMLLPVEQAKKETVTLTCFVKGFYPKEVLVSWLVDDVPADSNYDISTTNPVESNGFYSVYGQLTLSLHDWKDSDTVYSCVVYHESLKNTTKAIVRSFAHGSSAQTNLVNLNMNIPETCKAH